MARRRLTAIIGLLFAACMCGCQAAPQQAIAPAITEIPVIGLAPTPAVQHISLHSPTPSPTPAPTPTPTPTPAPTATPSPTDTPEPTATPKPTAKPTAKPKATAKPTATPKATEKPAATPKPTKTPKPTATPSPTPKPTEPPALAPAEGTGGDNDGAAGETAAPGDSDDAYSYDDVYLAAQVAYLEAKGKGSEAYRAVLSVILNRVEHKNSDIPTEVYRKSQFSVVNDDDFEATVPPDDVIRISDDVFNHGGANLPSKVRYFRAASKGKEWYDSFKYYDTIGGNAFFYEE